MKPAIEIENLSKKFRIHSERDQYLSLRDSLQLVFRKNSKEDFFALKNINLKVEQGESVGIVGRNGAGKSTLLKIISKITPPTTGTIIYRGRVASLLEVGTGFHSELTGRENIFMNGSILGMKRSEIKANFEAIVDFAGVEKFIDTPLKHYSSGMQLRLAFAVAAFLENEILIIDEVLAVGDAEFQKKCLGKMGEISKSGRTLLFVSHNMAALKSLCSRGVLLKDSTINFDGTSQKAIELYNDVFTSGITRFDLENVSRNRGTQFITFKEGVLDKPIYYPDSSFKISFRLNHSRPDITVNSMHIAAFIFDSLGNIVYQLSSMLLNDAEVRFSEDQQYSFNVDKLNLNAGVYSIGCWLQGNGFEQDYVEGQMSFEVGEGNIYGSSSPLIVSLIQKEFSFNVNN
jgi:lipopolysaccharide transport system ATP-binding protein